MIRYCYKRILLAVPVMVGISLLAFILGLLSPGDPAEFALNQDGLDGGVLAVDLVQSTLGDVWLRSFESLIAVNESDGLNGKPLADVIGNTLTLEAGHGNLLSGTIGDHGMAVMLARGDLAIDADIISDTAPVHELVEILLAAAPATRWMRDATRGGIGTVCNELAKDSPFAVILDENRIPVEPQVAGACDLLGIDPLYVANEGKFLAIVTADEADAAVAALRTHPQGAQAAVVGEIVAEPPGIVALRTAFGGSRIVDMLVGDPLPRIC